MRMIKNSRIIKTRRDRNNEMSFFFKAMNHKGKRKENGEFTYSKTKEIAGVGG